MDGHLTVTLITGLIVTVKLIDVFFKPGQVILLKDSSDAQQYAFHQVVNVDGMQGACSPCNEKKLAIPDGFE